MIGRFWKHLMQTILCIRSPCRMSCLFQYRLLDPPLKFLTQRSLVGPMCELLSHVRLFATPWTVACQAPLSMGFSRQEYWSGFPFPSPRDITNLGIKLGSPSLLAVSLPSEPPGKPLGGSWGFAVLLSSQEPLLLVAQGPHFECHWHRLCPRLPVPDWSSSTRKQHIEFYGGVLSSRSTWSFLSFGVSVNWWTSVSTKSFVVFVCFWPGCGILVPPPGIEPVPPAVEVQSHNHWTARELPLWKVLSGKKVMFVG